MMSLLLATLIVCFVLFELLFSIGVSKILRGPK